MTKKTEVQRKIKDKILDNNFRGIILSSVRSGKTRILLESVKEYTDVEFPSVLVLYPNIDIKKSWEKECEIINYYPDITYCTFASIEKVEYERFDFVIVDEAHLLGEENQLPIAARISTNNKATVFASGTYNTDTLTDLKLFTGMELIVNYPTEEAIKDGIVSDFTIFIHRYNLDETKLKEYGKVKKWRSTERKECNRLSNRVMNSIGQLKMFASLERMRFINSCDSLINKVNDWIKNNSNERFILFTSDEKTGLKYNLPMFNSKSADDSVLRDFQNGKINQLCLIKKASAGVTFPNLANILITAINSNGENLEQMIGRSLLDDTDHSNIHIFVSREPFQLKWLSSALELISAEKIKYMS